MQYHNIIRATSDPVGGHRQRDADLLRCHCLPVERNLLAVELLFSETRSLYLTAFAGVPHDSRGQSLVQLAMLDIVSRTGRRIVPGEFRTTEEYLLSLRHLFAYQFVKDMLPDENSVLEVGCGEGYGTSLVSQDVARIVGLDVDKRVIGHASAKYASERCFFQAYHGGRLPYGSNTFDAVISFQVIEHIRNDMDYVSEIHRVVRENSLFILTTPNRTYRLKPGERPRNRHHVREYYPHELENVLKSKFSHVDVWGIRGTEEVEWIERQRVKAGSGEKSYDPLSLRKLVPKAWRSTIIRVLQGIAGRTQGSNDFLDRYSLKDFWVTEENVSASLDLLGICRK